MAFHLAAWSESIDAGTLTPIDALADPSMTVSGDNISVPDYAPYLLGAVGIGANITRMRLEAPSLRRILNPEIRPLHRAAEPLSPAIVMLNRDNPIELAVNEQLQCLVTEDAAGASRVYGLVWLSDGGVTPVSDAIYTVRVTSATTLTANVWTNAALTFDQVLPVGRYGIVGARFESAGLIAFRFVFQTLPHRPGGLGCDDIADVEPSWQRYGGMGVWGEFSSTNPPTVDFLSASADTSEVGYLDLVQLS